MQILLFLTPVNLTKRAQTLFQPPQQQQKTTKCKHPPAKKTRTIGRIGMRQENRECIYKLLESRVRSPARVADLPQMGVLQDQDCW